MKYPDILPKFLRIISENFEKPVKKFQIKSGKISNIFEMYYRKFPNISRNNSESFGKYFVKFQEMFPKILKWSNFGKYRKLFWKFWKVLLSIEKYYQNYWGKIGKFRESLRRISRNISLNLEKYSGKFWELLGEFRKSLKKISSKISDLLYWLYFRWFHVPCTTTRKF